CLRIRCQNYNLRKRGIGQLRVVRKEKPRCSRSDIGCHDFRFGLLRQPAFDSFCRCAGRLDAGPRWKLDLNQQFKPVRVWKKMFPAYSPAVERAKPTGKNPITVTRVPASIGAAVWLQAYAAAWMRPIPSSIFTTMDSMAMMASSTKSPSEMMSAPNVIRSKTRSVIIMITN